MRMITTNSKTPTRPPKFQANRKDEDKSKLVCSNRGGSGGRASMANGDRATYAGDQPVGSIIPLSAVNGEVRPRGGDDEPKTVASASVVKSWSEGTKPAPLGGYRMAAAETPPGGQEDGAREILDKLTGCILELWRYRPDSKQCKCPICECLILNLVMQSSMLIQPGKEVGKIVRDIQLYNNTNLGGVLWPINGTTIYKAAGLPLLMRRGLWENLNITMLEYLCNSMHKIGLLLGVVYEVFELQFFPNGGIGIAVWFDLCIYGLVVFLLWDVIWQRWMVVFRRLL
ncbi:hypothetical protein SASPL_154810 [Salvia splendens]|uniref:Uncharacterized protein n=1 Tax=Salvia splendens TaxID=180675 RepID=A0A8X8W0Q3_SALSN|nr:hypothetical protein SASPL_154810 [Salvia splendens]